MSETGPLGTVNPSEMGDDGAFSDLRRTALLFYTIFKKELTIVVRYPVNFATGLVSTFAIFVLIVEGGRQFGGQGFSESIGGVIVGYLVFMMAQLSYSQLASSVRQEADWGTLERLHMSPLGFGRVVLFMAVSNMLITFLWIIILLPLTLLFTGHSLSIDPVTIIVLAVPGLCSVLGIGFVFGGASVLYKRVSRLFQLVQFVLIALIAAPVEQLPWIRALPIVQSNYMLGKAMREGVRLWEFSPRALGILFAVAIGYFLIGFVGFQLLVRRARKLGVLGDY
jgi:ABC-2 type transport system permease protein